MNLIASGPSFSTNQANLGRVCLLQFPPESHIDLDELQNLLPSHYLSSSKVCIRF